MSDDIVYRQFTRGDIDLGMRLKGVAGWNQLPEDWLRFLQLEPEGCFVALLGPDRVPVGTATTTAYGKRFGWIGMVLVDPDHRRKGIGTGLLSHAIHYLEDSGVLCVRLDATPLGKQLYDTLGFQDEYRLERRQGTGRSYSCEGVLPMTREHLSLVHEFDQACFGADRLKMLHILFDQSPEHCFVSIQDGKVRGFVMARPGANAFQIGPWSASSPAGAEQLLRAGLTALDNLPVFMDILPGQNDSLAIAERYGFTLQRDLIRMFKGRNEHPGKPENTFAICGAETG